MKYSEHHALEKVSLQEKIAYAMAHPLPIAEDMERGIKEAEIIRLFLGGQIDASEFDLLLSRTHFAFSVLTFDLLKTFRHAFTLIEFISDEDKAALIAAETARYQEARKQGLHVK